LNSTEPHAYDRFKQRYSNRIFLEVLTFIQIFEEMAKTFGFRSFEEVFRESYGQGTAPLNFKDQESLAGDSFFFRSWLRKSKNGREFPVPPRFFREPWAKIIQYFLKKTLGVREPDRGKDLEDVIYLNSQQALEGGKGKYLHRKRSKEFDHYHSSCDQGGSEDKIKKDGGPWQKRWGTR